LTGGRISSLSFGKCYGNLTTKLPPACQLVLLIVQGKIKFLPPLPLFLIFINKNIQKESFKIMVFLAMLATSHYIIEEQFRLRAQRV
jgi:hypothetical protein